MQEFLLKKREVVMSRIKKFVLSIVNAPQSGIRSSQTIYECLFYAISRYEQERSERWAVLASHVADSLCDIQLSDGGFDIGYEFLFAHGVRKSSVQEATCPEVLAIAALARYLDLEIDSPIRAKALLAVRAGVRWILRFKIEMENGAAMPYAPYSLSGVHITNATSFASSALACSLHYLEGEDRELAEGAVRDMCLFMRNQLVLTANGGFWPYFYQEGDVLQIDKIDNYHIAQQLFHHCLVNKSAPNDDNSFIIDKVSNYLLGVQSEDGYVPYALRSGKSSGYVSVWGFAALVSAFVAAAKVTKQDVFLVGAKRARRYLIERCRVGDHFAAVVDHPSGAITDPRYYPRSDAWVIHGLVDLACGEDLDICDHIFQKIISSDYRGDENHTLTLRKRAFYAIVNIVRKKKAGQMRSSHRL